MPLAAGAREGFALGAAILALSVYFVIRQIRERRNRSDALSDADRRYFSGKDFRRFANSGVMALIAFGIMILGAADPRRPKAQQLAIAGILAFVSLLVLALIVIAVVDWFATATYGSRQRRALAEERLAVLEEEVRKLSASRGESNGKPKVNREV